MTGFTSDLAAVRIGDVAEYGGKNASLGEMIAALGARGVRVPEGFATRASLYREFIARNALAPRLRDLIGAWTDGRATLRESGAAIRALLLDAALPPAGVEAIAAAYDDLARRLGVADPAVAVRSSATAEDLPDASFAGQQETFLNIRGTRALLDACRRCFASLFTDRAIAYRQAKGFDHLAVALSIGVQRMVRADKAGSGVMFTVDPDSGFPNAIVLSAAWGLGELVVQGEVDPDRYTVFKPLVANEKLAPIIGKDLGGKARKMIYAEGGSRRTRIVDTSAAERSGFVLTDSEILQLARWGQAVEAHYGRFMDLEWAKDGDSGALFIVQARPETVQAHADRSRLVHYALRETGPVIARGAAVGSAIAAGPACLIRDAADTGRFPDGAILVTEMTDPDLVPVMRHAAGIVTDHGGATSHAAIVSRELGVPAVVGTGDASRTIRDGQPITLSCAGSEHGLVYDGMLRFEREDVDLARLPTLRTQVMVNLADPAAAFEWWRLPVQGVGLARMEFIINALIRIHPMALAHPEQIDDAARAEIDTLTAGYADPQDYFVDRLSRGIARIAAAVHPHPAIVRLSDFKTNEYGHLIGGAAFEPREENPMLGFRGACRYADPRYRDGFALECRALKRVREEMGFDNVVVMIPFCRTPAEADRVLAEMAGHGLARGAAGLQVYMMCEIPSNIILAEAFARRFDGFSIGSNDLTQLVLGVDRDSELLAERYDARDPAVQRMIAEVIAVARREGVKIGLCGQAPSDHPDFAAFLVHCGIDSISLNPDSVLRTIPAIAEAERRFIERARGADPGTAKRGD
jgi:pyruvate,water dikinase